MGQAGDVGGVVGRLRHGPGDVGAVAVLIVRVGVVVHEVVGGYEVGTRQVGRPVVARADYLFLFGGGHRAVLVGRAGIDNRHDHLRFPALDVPALFGVYEIRFIEMPLEFVVGVVGDPEGVEDVVLFGRADIFSRAVRFQQRLLAAFRDGDNHARRRDAAAPYDLAAGPRDGCVDGRLADVLRKPYYQLSRDELPGLSRAVQPLRGLGPRAGVSARNERGRDEEKRDRRDGPAGAGPCRPSA